MKKTLITLGIWLASQIIITAILSNCDIISFITVNDVIAPSLVISDAIVILAIIILRYCRISEFFQHTDLRLFFYSTVFGFFSLYMVDLLIAPLDFPNYMEETFRTIADSPWGFPAICILAPVMEEMMLRRVIMKEMTRLTKSDWGGILISATLFAIIHFNPIQVIFALPAGIILGWLYYKTGRIIVPIAVHVLNNTVAFLQIRFEGTWLDNSDLCSSDIYRYVIIILCLILTVLTLIKINGIIKQQSEESVPETQGKEPADIRKGLYCGDNYEK